MFSPGGDRTCSAIAFALFWSAGTLVFDAVAVLTLAGRIDAPPGQGPFLVLFQLPFNAVMVGMWGSMLSAARDDRSPAGAGRASHTATGWVVRLPDPGGWFAVGLVLFVVPILGVFGLFGVFRAMPPAWATAGVLVVVCGLVAWLRFWWGSRPVLVIDDRARTVTFHTARREPPETVPWAAVKRLGIAETSGGSGDDGVETVTRYEVWVLLDGKGGTREFRLTGRPRREPLQVLVAWLRDRLGTPAG